MIAMSMPSPSILSGDDNPNHPELLTADEVAQILKMDVSQVYKLIRAGEIKAVRYGKSIRVMRRDLNDSIEYHKDH